jgi:hypothetical protein
VNKTFRITTLIVLIMICALGGLMLVPGATMDTASQSHLGFYAVAVSALVGAVALATRGQDISKAGSTLALSLAFLAAVIAAINLARRRSALDF